MTGWIFLIMFGWALYTVVKKFLNTRRNTGGFAKQYKEKDFADGFL